MTPWMTPRKNPPRPPARVVSRLRAIGCVALFGLATTALSTGCALLRGTPDTEQTPEIVHRVDSSVPPVDIRPNAVTGSGTLGGRDVSSLDRSDLEGIEKISITASYVDVSLVAGTAARKKGTLKIARVAGDPSCKLRFQEIGKSLEITEATRSGGKAAFVHGKSSVPEVAGCHFSIDVALHDAAATTVDVTRGALSAEGWEAPLQIKMDWGDIDVGSVGPLSVTCGRCTVSGEGVSGPLHYSLQTGNVGLAGLVGSVEGQTLGDTVLRWRKLKADSSVKLVSHAGDVILFFPGSIPLAIDLNAPRGEVRTKVGSGERGVPVSVTAELGNVQVYRESGGKKAE